MIAAVLFDFDGTLVDTRNESWVLFEQTNREFALGIDSPAQYFALFTRNIYEGLVDHCGDATRGAAAAAHFMGLVREHYDPPLVPGMAQLIRALADDFTLAIVSSNTQATLNRLLARDELIACFQAVIAGDMEPSKSRAIERFITDNGYAPAQVILVTDTTGDIFEAKRAGVAAYGVAWGMHDANALRAAGALDVAHEPRELQAWIDQQHKNLEGGRRCRATL